MAFGVTVDFTANVAKFTDQVDRLSGNLDRFGKKAERSFGLAKKAFVGLGAAVATGTVANQFNSLVDAGDRLQKLSLRLGDSVENLSRLQLVADLSGVSFENMTTGLQRMTRRVAEAAQGSGEAVKAIKELGLSAEALAELSQTDQLKAFADAFDQVGNAGDKVRLASKIFDTEGVAILQAMQKGADGIQIMLDKSDQLGRTLSGDLGNQMALYNDNMTELGASSEKFGLSVANFVLPTINKVIGNLKEATEAGVTFNNVMRGFGLDFIFDADGLRGLSSGIDEINNKIVAQREKIQALENPSGVGSLVDDLLGYDVTVEKRELDLLLRERQQILADFKQQRDSQTASIAEGGTVALAAPTSTARRSSSNRTLDDIDKTNAKLDQTRERLLAIYDPDLSKLNEGIAQVRDMFDVGLLNEGEFQSKITALAEAYNDGFGESAQRLQAFFNPDLSNLEAGISRVQEALREGIISEERASQEFSQLADIYNDSFIDPAKQRLEELFNPDLTRFKQQIADVTQGLELGVLSPVDASVNLTAFAEEYRVSFLEPALEGTNQLSEFSSQAARNMQDAFADFLFDPFEDGLDGMLKSFATVLQRMAAEAAASGIFDLFQDSGIGSAIFSGIGDILTGSFHDGGVIGQDSGRMMSVNPIVFAGAERFHSGGYPGLKSDEVPAILQTGERVLSRVEVSLFAKLLQILDSKQSVVDIQKLVAPVFHQGGTVGGYAPHKMIDHLLFLGARRYHDGGYISGGGLSSSSYNTQSGNLGGISISTTVNVSGSETTRDNANRLGDQLNSRIMEVLAQEKRPGGLLNN